MATRTGNPSTNAFSFAALPLYTLFIPRYREGNWKRDKCGRDVSAPPPSLTLRA